MTKALFHNLYNSWLRNGLKFLRSFSTFLWWRTLKFGGCPASTSNNDQQYPECSWSGLLVPHFSMPVDVIAGPRSCGDPLPATATFPSCSAKCWPYRCRSCTPVHGSHGTLLFHLPGLGSARSLSSFNFFSLSSQNRGVRGRGGSVLPAGWEAERWPCAGAPAWQTGHQDFGNHWHLEIKWQFYLSCNFYRKPRGGSLEVTWSATDSLRVSWLHTQHSLFDSSKGCRYLFGPTMPLLSNLGGVSTLIYWHACIHRPPPPMLISTVIA